MNDNEARARELALKLCGVGCGCEDEDTTKCEFMDGQTETDFGICRRQERAIANAILAAEARGLRNGLVEARNVMPIAYREGFAQGMKDFTTHKGGKIFEESICAKRQAAIDARLASLSQPANTEET